MIRPLHIVVIGLSLSSSWGNGHATTFRALLDGLRRLGHKVTFLEQDVPWYAANRDLPQPKFCDLVLYDDTDSLMHSHGDLIDRSDAVIIGSYVREGPAVIDQVMARASGPVAFYDIDTPVTLAKLDRGDEEYLRRSQVPGFDIYFSFTGGPTLRRLERDYAARRAVALYCSVQEERYRPESCQPLWDLGYLGTYSNDRQPTLERLLIETARRLPRHRFVVAGPQYPGGINWPANVERIEHLPPARHAWFYNRQRFTLNVTRADMIASGWSPSVRLFEAGACGTPIISDWWEGLTDLLPEGDALLVAESTHDVVTWLSDMTEDGRMSIARCARALVLGAHTGEARAAELVGALRPVIADRRRLVEVQPVTE
jgi:spore maturation protein CgeB